MSYRISIDQAGEPVPAGKGQTVLAAALAAGIRFPHGCSAGNCGACKSRLISGEVRRRRHPAYALTAAEKRQGLILACRAVPKSDCAVGWLDDDAPPDHPRRELICTVSALDDLTPDLKRLSLTVDSDGPLAFSAGQYVSLGFGGLPPRDYSMANRPDVAELEFHIRDHGEGASAHVARFLRPGDPVTLDGPHGSAYLRPWHTGPIVAVAAGAGLAPMKSIVETALAKGAKQPITLFLGGRDADELYLVEHFEALARKHRNFSFMPVLSDPSRPGPHRTGHLSALVAGLLGDPDGVKAYLAGPPAMVEATTQSLHARGVRARDIHADAFYSEAEKRILGALR